MSNRVMDGDVYAWYNPANSLTTDEEETIENEKSEASMPARGDRQIGLASVLGDVNVVQNVLDQQNHWQEVNDKQEHTRLHLALFLASKG